MAHSIESDKAPRAKFLVIRRDSWAIEARFDAFMEAFQFVNAASGSGAPTFDIYERSSFLRSPGQAGSSG